MLCDSASLILSSLSSTNPPTINAQYSQFTFNNIDLKNVMGEMWDKYDTFCLKVASWSNAQSVTISGGHNGAISYNMAGLEWTNVIYEATNSSTNKQWIPLVFMNLVTSTSTQVQNIVNTGQSYNFKKGNRNVNLEFAIAACDTTGANNFGNITAGNIYNDICFQLIFEPVIKGKMNECAFFGFNSNVALTNINRVISTDRKEYYYANFDIKNLCNEFWDNHENFEIHMPMVLIRGIATYSGDVRLVPIQISGLNFVNNGTKQSNITDKLNLSTENALAGTIL